MSALGAQTDWRTAGPPRARWADAPGRRAGHPTLSRGRFDVRVIASRTSDRESGQQALVDGVDLDSVHLSLASRQDDADDIAWDCEGRAGIEPLLEEPKAALGIGHQSS